MSESKVVPVHIRMESARGALEVLSPFFPTGFVGNQKTAMLPKSEELKKHSSIIVLISAIGVASIANASNTLIGGDLATGSNWASGAPTTVGNIGIINIDNTGVNAGILSTTTGFFIKQTGGKLNPSGITQTFDNTQYQLIDGSLAINSLVLSNGSIFSVSGGIAAFGGSSNTRSLTINNLGAVNISGGVVDVCQDITFGNTNTETDKVYNLSGGTINVARHVASGFQADGTLNFSGDVSLTVGNTFGVNQAGNSRAPQASALCVIMPGRLSRPSTFAVGGWLGS